MMRNLAGRLLLVVVAGALFACNRAVSITTDADTEPVAAAEAIFPPADTWAEDTGAPSGGAFVIARRVETYGTFVTIRPEGQEHPSIDWRLESKQIHIEWDRGQSLAQQTTVLLAMMRVLAVEGGGAAPGATSAIATLDCYTNPEYVKRLAEAAANDEEWTGSRGRAKRHADPPWTLHKYIVHITESKRLLPELEEIFAPLQVRPRLKSVEKCSSARPGSRGEIGKWLKENGVQSKKELPAGCLTAWFKLEPLNSLNE